MSEVLRLVPAKSTHPCYCLCRGTFIPASFPPEPNNLGGSELCAGGNNTQEFSDAYGWADAECTRPSVFICELLRECHGLPCTWASVCGVQAWGWALAAWYGA
jgi:hypothetical protein